MGFLTMHFDNLHVLSSKLDHHEEISHISSRISNFVLKNRPFSTGFLENVLSHNFTDFENTVEGTDFH